MYNNIMTITIKSTRPVLGTLLILNNTIYKVPKSIPLDV